MQCATEPAAASLNRQRLSINLVPTQEDVSDIAGFADALCGIAFDQDAERLRLGVTQEGDFGQHEMGCTQRKREVATIPNEGCLLVDSLIADWMKNESLKTIGMIDWMLSPLRSVF